MGKTQTKLEPIDFTRCQAVIREGSFMTFGPRSQKRCEYEPSYVAIDKDPDEDGMRGGMALCSDCQKVCENEMGDRVVFQEIIR